MNEKTKHALKLALEALEESLGYVEEEAENAQRLYGQYPTRQARIQGLKDDARKHMDAITAIREALADNALDRMAENARELGLDYEPPCKTGSQCTSKCQQCEQPAQQQEPFCYHDGRNIVGKEYAHHSDVFPLYTFPQPSKPWVELTDEEFQWIYDNGRTPAGMIEMAEAKLREKNNG